jgi:hypothetical protein
MWLLFAKRVESGWERDALNEENVGKHARNDGKRDRAERGIYVNFVSVCGIEDERTTHWMRLAWKTALRLPREEDRARPPRARSRVNDGG